MNIINRPRAVLKNFSQRTTAATANVTRFDPLSRLQRKQLIIFTVFLLVLTSLLTISGCAPVQPCHTQEQLTVPSLDEVTQSSSTPSELTSNGTPKDYVYQTSKPLVRSISGVVASPSGSVKLNASRLVKLTDVIGIETLAKANELYALSARSNAPIDILIDSPGGSVNAGLYFIEAMHALQAKKITIRCHVENLAASMAYTIFTQCDEKNALPYALLLFHPPRIQGKFLITPQSAVELANGLVACEKTLVDLIMPAMGIPQEPAGEVPTDSEIAAFKWFIKNYIEERLFTATELYTESPVKWFKIVSEVVVK